MIQKFTQDESEPLVSVLSTQEAFARVASMKEHGASHFDASDAENVPRVLPQQLQVVLPSEQDTSAMEHAVMTPQVLSFAQLFPLYPCAGHASMFSACPPLSHALMGGTVHEASAAFKFDSQNITSWCRNG